MSYPKVAVNDPGIRPAGPPDACFYCRERVGGEHGKECVMVQRRVRVKFIIEADITVPAGWDPGMIEFRYNESSWCADNLASMLGNAKGDAGCWCPSVSCEYIREVDQTPTVHSGSDMFYPDFSSSVRTTEP